MRQPRAQLAALLILAALVRLPTLSHRGLWTDELSTLEAVRLPTADLIRDRAANWRWWAAYVGWTLLGFLSHSTYIFIALAQALTVGAWLVRARRWRRDWALVTLALAAAAAAALTALHRFQTNVGFYGTRGWPGWAVWRGGILQLFWGEYDNLFGSGFKYIGLPLAAVVVALAWRGRRSGAEENSELAESWRPPAFALAATWTFSILAGMALVSGLWRDVIGGYRYYAGGLGGAALLQGLAVGSLRSPRARRALLAICLAIQGAVSFGWLRGPGEQVREAIRYVAEHRSADEPVVFCDDAHAQTLADYYHLGAAPIALSRDVKDRDQVERLLETNLRASPGFWIILYKEEKSPLESVARSWAQGRFDLTGQQKYRAARVLAFRRILNSSP
ncbi:MAG: hypothetical protein NTW86_23855 [Candidatus Sumerlaeota bacterium]|nr:hypothetical protein [Candidatus Sumerlaeota bacterium]